MSRLPAIGPIGAETTFTAMDGFGLRFHHLGWIVRAPDAAFRFLAALGYHAGNTAFDPLQNVNLAMRHHPEMPDVEVIWPADGPSPIDLLLKRGNMIYHVCYVTDDAAASLAAMAAAGLDVLPVGEAKPARLFGGSLVSFHTIDDVGLIEFIHGEPAQ